MGNQLFRLGFHRITERLPDPDIDEDNGLRKSVVNLFLDNEYSIAGVVNTMCADGWTLDIVCQTLQYQERKENENGGPS